MRLFFLGLANVLTCEVVLDLVAELPWLGVRRVVSESIKHGVQAIMRNIDTIREIQGHTLGTVSSRSSSPISLNGHHGPELDSIRPVGSQDEISDTLTLLDLSECITRTTIIITNIPEFREEIRGCVRIGRLIVGCDRRIRIVDQLESHSDKINLESIIQI